MFRSYPERLAVFLAVAVDGHHLDDQVKLVDRVPIIIEILGSGEPASQNLHLHRSVIGIDPADIARAEIGVVEYQEAVLYLQEALIDSPYNISITSWISPVASKMTSLSGCSLKSFQM